MPANLFFNLHRPVVVAMVAMRVMQASVNQIVNVIAVRNGGMTAFRSVNVLGGMFGGGETRRALVGVRGTDGNRVFVHMIAVRMMQMAVVKIVHMSVMLDGGVSAAGAVNVGVIGVCRARTGFFHGFIGLVFRVYVDVSKSISTKPPLCPVRQEMFLQATCILA